MRVLLTNHLPFHGSTTGRYMLGLAQGLVQAGHEVRALVVDSQLAGDEPFRVRRIVCQAGDSGADLPFDVPGFGAHPGSKQTFAGLSDLELADYREQNRRVLDLEVEAFDPQIIHAQHIWIQGHLALETGVPYVLSVSGDDLAEYHRDVRFRALAQQAAENAGRILATSEALRQDVIKLFGEVADRVEVLPSAGLDNKDPQSARWIEQIVAIYQQVRNARFGEPPLL